MSEEKKPSLPNTNQSKDSAKENDTPFFNTP